MIDKGLINVLAEILDQPEEDILKYFTPREKTKEKVKVSNSTDSRPVDNRSDVFYTTVNKIEKAIKEIQKTLEEDAHQRHALELQMNAINKRVDALENKAVSNFETNEVYEYLTGLEAELRAELRDLNERKTITVEDSAKIYRCNIQLDLLTDIINTLYRE